MDRVEIVIKLSKQDYELACKYPDTLLGAYAEAISKGMPLDKIRADIIKYESDCRLSVDEYPQCKKCNDNVFKAIYGILDKYKESEAEDEQN